MIAKENVKARELRAYKSLVVHTFEISPFLYLLLALVMAKVITPEDLKIGRGWKGKFWWKKQ